MPVLVDECPFSPLQAVPEQYRNLQLTSTPCVNDSINSNFASTSCGMRNKKRVIRDEEHDKKIGLEPKERNSWAVMYIDDLSIGEVHDMDTAVSLFSQRKEERESEEKEK